MSTNAEQLQFLKLKVDTLRCQDRSLGLSDKCISLMADLSKNPNSFKEITEEEYEAMLPKEKDDNIFLYTTADIDFKLQQLQNKR